MVLEDGSVSNENDFLSLSLRALLQCKEDVEGEKFMKAFMVLGKYNCEKASGQKNKIFEGFCYMKVVDTIKWIL